MDKYEVVRLLQTGSSAAVYLAVNRDTNTHVAVKIMDKQKRPADLIYNETWASRRLTHPNVVNLIETIDTVKYYVIVQEYLPGGDLFDAIVPDKGMPAHEAVEYFVQVVDGLRYMHEQNVAHRDIKPENVVRDSTKKVAKLIDFGFSCPANRGASSNCGTLPYLPPEAIGSQMYNNGFGRDPKAIDVWSAGILFFTLLTGTFPWAQATTTNTEFVRFTRNDYTHAPWNSFSSTLIDLLQRMLHLDPRKRMSMADVHAFIVKHTADGCTWVYAAGAAHQESETQVVPAVVDSEKTQIAANETASNDAYQYGKHLVDARVHTAAVGSY
eukprot:Opistho-2@41550